MTPPSIVTSKRCSKCRAEKLCTEFYRRYNGIGSHCKECCKAAKMVARKKPEHQEYIRAYNKKWRAENPEKLKAWYEKNHRRTTLRHAYGMTEEAYDERVAAQNGCCAICGRHQATLKKPLYVDHNHATGAIRGLLCHNCNVALGLFHDKHEVLTKAAEYLVWP